jgi:hypothetical protein
MWLKPLSDLSKALQLGVRIWHQGLFLGCLPLNTLKLLGRRALNLRRGDETANL